MTVGALIFAINNEKIDYEQMARWSTRNIERHLGIPTHIVTKTQPGQTTTNSRQFEDFGTAMTWHNQSRADAYELSPWDQTLLLDADYVVASDQLKSILDSDQDFLAHRWAYDVTGLNDFDNFNHFGNFRMPMWWATVIMFRRTAHSKLIFDAMSMVRENWHHYRKLFGTPNRTYRNDHALSIALEIVTGHTQSHPEIPWNLASLTPEHRLTCLGPDQYRVDFVDSDRRSRWIQLNNQDFHAMGKLHLGAIIENNS